MAFTTSDLTKIERAIASGARSVTLGDSTVIFNTGDSLIRARELMIKELNAASDALAPVRRSKQRYLVQTGRGY